MAGLLPGLLASSDQMDALACTVGTVGLNPGCCLLGSSSCSVYSTTRVPLVWWPGAAAWPGTIYTIIPLVPLAGMRQVALSLVH